MDLTPTELLDQALNGALSPEAVEICRCALLAHVEFGTSLDESLGLSGDGSPWSSPRSKLLLRRRQEGIEAIAAVIGGTSTWGKATAVHALLRKRFGATSPPTDDLQRLADTVLQVSQQLGFPSERTIYRALL